MSSPPLHPSMNTRHMGIQIFDPTEGVVPPSHSQGPCRRRAPSWQNCWSTHSCALSWTCGHCNSSGSGGREKPHLPQACPPHGPPYDAASYSAYLHNASHSQDTGWTSLGCKLVGEPITCAMRPESCHICCMDTSLHGEPPCVSSTCGGWVAASHTQGTPWHPSPLQAAGMALQPPHRLQPPLAGLHLSGERTLAASPS